jgi:hypothetical protein
MGAGADSGVGVEGHVDEGARQACDEAFVEDGDSVDEGDLEGMTEFEKYLELDLLSRSDHGEGVQPGEVQRAAEAVAHAVTGPARVRNANMTVSDQPHPLTFDANKLTASLVMQFWLQHGMEQPLELDRWRHAWCENGYYSVLLWLCITRLGCDGLGSKPEA